jgi:hypothetical protein
VRDEELNQILDRAQAEPHDLKPEVLDRIAASVKASLAPVHPLPSNRLLTAGVLLVCSAVSLLGAARAGFFGFAKMDLLERWTIFVLLGALAWAASRGFVYAMIPGSRRRVSAPALVAFSCLALLALFALLFRDYQIEHFFSIGIVCLATGVLHAIPAAFVSWILLRRGFAVDAVKAGLAAGLVGGLAGVAMLELHCPNFEAAHVLVWHIAVVPISGALGAAVGWLLDVRRARGQPQSTAHNHPRR